MAFKDMFGSAWRYFVTDGVPASGPWKPSKSEITAIGAALDSAFATAVAGITTVSNTAARDTFYADPANQSKLVYVNNNNGSSTDPANGVYEYVGGAPRIADGFYQGLASVVQPLVDEAQDAADEAVAASAVLADQTSTGFTRPGATAAFSSRLGYGTSYWVGTDLTADDIYVSHTIPSFRAQTGATKVRYRLWEGLLSDAQNLAPGASTHDTLELDLTFNVTDFPGLVSGGSAVAITVPFGTHIRAREGRKLEYESWVEDGSGNRLIVGAGVDSTGTYPQISRQTWFRPTATTWSVASGESVGATFTKAITYVARDPSSLIQDDKIAENAADIVMNGGNIDSLVAKVGTSLSNPVSNTYGIAPATGASWAGTGRLWFIKNPFVSGGILTEFDVNIGLPGAGSIWVVSASGQVLSKSDINTTLTGNTTLVSGTDFPTGLVVPPNGRVALSGTVLQPTFDSSGGPGIDYYVGTPNVGDTITLSTLAGFKIYMRATVTTYADAIERRLEALEVGSSTILPKSKGCTGLTGYLGRCELVYDNSTAKTFRLAMTVPTVAFDQVRVWFGCGGAMTIASAAVKAITSPAGIADTTGFSTLSFGGNAGMSIPGPTGAKGVSFGRSDALPLNSVARTDGGTWPMILIAGYVTTPSLTLMGASDGSTNRLNWATHPEYPWISRANNGDCVTTPANFTSTTNISTSPIAFVEFVADGQVVSVVSIGDSIANGEGGGITYDGASFGFEACRALTTSAGITYGHANIAWSGTTTDTFLRRLQAMVSAGFVPDAVFVPVWSPNDIPGTAPSTSTITSALIATMRQHLKAILDFCQSYGIKPLVWTGLPTNTSVKIYGASDSLRRAYNDTVRAFAGRGIVVMDFDFIAAGSADGSGQIQYKSGFTSDGIHPDDSGILLLASAAGHSITAAGLTWSGSLVTS